MILGGRPATAAPPPAAAAVRNPGRAGRPGARGGGTNIHASRPQPANIWATVGVLFLLTAEAVISAFSYPYFSLALQKYDLSTWLIGLNASLAGAGILFIGPFLPRLIAAVGLARLAAVMYALPILCFAAIIGIDNVSVWFVSRFVMGACFAALWATTEIWLNGVVDDRWRGRVMALAMVLYTAAQFVGPLMVSATGVGGALPLLAAMAPLGLGFVLALFIDDHGTRSVSSEPTGSGSGFRAAFSLARSLIAASFFIGIASAAIQSLLPLFALAQGLSDEGASRLVAIFGLGEFALVGSVGLLADRYGRRALLRFGAVLALALTVAFPLVANSTPALATMLFAAGGVLGAIYTLGLILIGQDFRDRHLAVAATGFAMAYSAGTIVGSTPVGYLIDVFGRDALPAAIAASLLATAWFAFDGSRAFRRGERIRTFVDDELRS